MSIDNNALPIIDSDFSPRRTDFQGGIGTKGPTVNSGVVISEPFITYDVERIRVSFTVSAISGSYVRCEFLDSSGNWDIMGTYSSYSTSVIESTSSQYKHASFKVRFYGYVPEGGKVTLDNFNCRITYDGYHHQSYFTWNTIDTGSYDWQFSVSWRSLMEDCYWLVYDYTNKEWDYAGTNSADVSLESVHINGNRAKVAVYFSDVDGDNSRSRNEFYHSTNWDRSVLIVYWVP